MLPLTGYFEEMFKRIRPSKERRRLADNLPDEVRDHLAKSDRLDTVRNPPVTRLAGSYGRRTGQGDIHDVDVIVFVEPHYADYDPDVVLDDLAEALRELEVEGYGKGEVKTNRKNRRSHHVEFKKDGEKAFHIDCVPVVRSGGGPEGVLRIPDREWVDWDDTQPLGYGARLTELNQANEEKVLPTIRMLKRIRERHLRKSLRRPKSYWLESKVYHVWRSGALDKDWPWATLMYELLKAVRRDCGATPMTILDPCLWRNLTETWAQDEYDEFLAMLDRVIGELDEIAFENDPGKAVAAWQEVFGAEVFRLADKATKAEGAVKALRDGVTVTWTGGVVPTSSGIAGVHAPAHRFYGDE